MPKYTTNRATDPDPDAESASCALCGATDNLTTANIAESTVVICQDCKARQETTAPEESTTNGQSERGGYTITNPNSDWVKETRPRYTDNTPYLKREYDTILLDALRETELTVIELAEQAELPEETVRAILDGNAVEHGVTTDEIETIESLTDVQLQEEI